MNVLTDVNCDVPVIKVSKSQRVSNASVSRGNQIKWRKDNVWIKANLLGYEGTAEVIVSHFLSFTDLAPEQYITYYSCRIIEDGIDRGYGCYSFDFIEAQGYDEITVGNILDDNLESYSIEYEPLRELLYDYFKHDPKDFLDRILCVDSIIRNCDRHFNNIILLYKNGKYIEGPIFDNGDSCLSDLVSYPMDMPFEEAFDDTWLAAKPFKCDYRRNLVGNKRLHVRYGEYVKHLNVTHHYCIRAVKTILRGLKEMEGLAWVKV